LQPTDVEYVEMSFGDMGAALGGRAIDVCIGYLIWTSWQVFQVEKM